MKSDKTATVMKAAFDLLPAIPWKGEVPGLGSTLNFTHLLSTDWISVKSRSTPVGGPVKSGRKRTKGESRGLDNGLVRPELRPIGFNDKGVER